MSKGVLGRFFWKRFFFAQCSMESSKFLKKIKKKFQNSKSAQNCSQKCPNVFWTCFGAIFPIFFAQCSMQGFSGFLDFKIWVQFSGLKIKSSVFRNNTQQTFSLHSRHCQYTQSHFRLSRPKIISSDSRTQKYDFSFLDLKKLNSVFRT